MKPLECAWQNKFDIYPKQLVVWYYWNSDWNLLSCMWHSESLLWIQWKWISFSVRRSIHPILFVSIHLCHTFWLGYYVSSVRLSCKTSINVQILLRMLCGTCANTEFHILYRNAFVHCCIAHTFKCDHRSTSIVKCGWWYGFRGSPNMTTDTNDYGQFKNIRR